MDDHNLSLYLQSGSRSLPSSISPSDLKGHSGGEYLSDPELLLIKQHTHWSVVNSPVITAILGESRYRRVSSTYLFGLHSDKRLGNIGAWYPTAYPSV